MEVLISQPPTDFNFDSACSSPFRSTPTSPKHFGSNFYYSAPTSPAASSSIYQSFYKDLPSKSNQEDDFAFDFGAQVGRNSLTADELFDDGKIRPLQTPKSPVTTNDVPKERGRERVTSSSSRRSGTRSLSPLRSSEQRPKPVSSNTKSSSKKWRLKDFLLFRSASEGRATSKDPLTKYSLLSKKTEVSIGSGLRKKGQVSAHELHYTSNRAVTEELKRKTFLPYKQGLFGWLGFGPTVHSQGVTRG